MASKSYRLAQKLSDLSMRLVDDTDLLETALEDAGGGMSIGLNPSRALSHLKGTAGTLVKGIESLDTALAAENAKNAKRKGK